MSTKPSWEKTSRRLEAELEERKQLPNQRRAKHGSRKATTKQVRYMKYLAFTTGAEPIRNCCAMHVSWWIDGAKALEDESFYIE